MRFLIGVFLLLGLAACGGETAPQQGMTSADRGQIQAEVLDWSDQWLAAATGLDAQGVSGLMDPADAHFLMGGAYQATWQDILSFSQSHFLTLAEWQGEWGMRRIDVLAPDAALFVGETVGNIRLSDGTEAENRSVFSFVVRKKDGLWTGLYGQAGEVADSGL